MFDLCFFLLCGLVFFVEDLLGVIFSLDDKGDEADDGDEEFILPVIVLTLRLALTEDFFIITV